MALLSKVKVCVRLTSNAYDDELTDMIEAAKQDLAVAGVDPVDESDPLITRAIITYCKANFGSPDAYDKLKAAYDEQKAQLSMHTGHTDWGETND